jgi:lysophosphatidylcholine acyltransferase/lyso-PAF acetyltransferase
MLAEQGKTPPILIYPEGATTNGEALVYFNKGAFASLRPVQPIVLKYWTLNNIKAS